MAIDPPTCVLPPLPASCSALALLPIAILLVAPLILAELPIATPLACDSDATPIATPFPPLASAITPMAIELDVFAVVFDRGQLSLYH